jgi:hypothetical protein
VITVCISGQLFFPKTYSIYILVRSLIDYADTEAFKVVYEYLNEFEAIS